MTHISEILDEDQLVEEIGNGYVSESKHPDFPLYIYNYTPKTQYEKRWNNTTLNCRGLILDVSGKVVARGMPKFFNYGEPEAPKFGPDQPVYVSNKYDGSLGISYVAPDGSARIATRGSFTSEQALHATNLLTEDAAEEIKLMARYFNRTIVFEIIYPENRIVVDYGDADELVALGIVSHRTGWFFPLDSETMTFQSALELPDRENAEGLVISSIFDGGMLKIKQPDYVEKHRVVTGMSKRTVWQWMVDGRDVDKMIAALPDEFHMWADEVYTELELETDVRVGWYQYTYTAITDALDRDFGEGQWTKKDLAMKVKDRDDSWAMFALYNGEDIWEQVLKNIKPPANKGPWKEKVSA